MRTWDTSIGYGWISIALHWVTAVIITVLWYTGSMSQLAAGAERYAQLIRLHTTVALTAYVLLWLRVLWRMRLGHPGPRPGQHSRLLHLGKAVHYVLLLAIAVLLVTGPLMVLFGGGEIGFYRFTVHSPFGEVPALRAFLRRAHGIAGTVVLVGTMLHVLAVLMHTVIFRDGTFDKIMIPAGSGPK